MEETPKKRKRLSRQEALDIGKRHGKKKIKEATEEIVKILADLEEVDFDDEIRVQLENTQDQIRRKLHRLLQEDKSRKFRNNPEQLDTTFVSASQFSDLADSSPPSSLDLFSKDLYSGLQDNRPSEYEKAPITDPNLSKKTLRRRTKEFRDIFEDKAREFGCTTVQLAGLFIYLDSYPQDRQTAQLGWNLFEGKAMEKQVSTPEAVWIMERNKMSWAGYQELRLRLLDRLVLPPRYLISEMTKRSLPSLEEYNHGVRASLTECIKLTLEEQLSLIKEVPRLINFKFCYGMDGSGQHSDYEQKSKKDYSTSSVVFSAFSLISISSSITDEILWETTAHNSPSTIRPLALFPSKETVEMLKDYAPTLDTEMKKIQQDGISLIMPNGQHVTALFTAEGEEPMTMLDGKMITQLLGLGGAYCTMCDLTILDCHNPTNIEREFSINRDIAALHMQAFLMCEEGEGEILRNPSDYQARSGITSIPITEADLTKNIPVCHLKVHIFTWIRELMIRQNSHQKWHCSEKPVRFTPVEKAREKEAEEKLRIEVKEALAINIGDATKMVEGNKFKAFSSDTARGKLALLIEDSDKREDFRFIHLGLCAITRVISSQHQKIDTDKYRKFSTELSLRIVTAFPWAVISPSLHRVLAHGWERIEMHKGLGLGGISEEGLEAQNKHIRYLREHGARKTSTEENFHDVWVHLWKKSSPTLCKMDREKRKRQGKMYVLDEIDSLVESFFE